MSKPRIEQMDPGAIAEAARIVVRSVLEKGGGLNELAVSMGALLISILEGVVPVGDLMPFLGAVVSPTTAWVDNCLQRELAKGQAAALPDESPSEDTTDGEDANGSLTAPQILEIEAAARHIIQGTMLRGGSYRDLAKMIAAVTWSVVVTQADGEDIDNVLESAFDHIAYARRVRRAMTAPMAGRA